MFAEKALEERNSIESTKQSNCKLVFILIILSNSQSALFIRVSICEFDLKKLRRFNELELIFFAAILFKKQCEGTNDRNYYYIAASLIFTTSFYSSDIVKNNLINQ